ncbi:Transcription factor [Parasponia andersonii]|uniref:Transcription factor n=1 Tax=Parasponia andersonii TaxID=3476 RepID=A0A2P5BKX0_PARAD|nr:Transcription factor [Parasponia andersonii]
MSARLLKKFLKEQELQIPEKDPHHKEAEAENEDEEEEQQLNSGSSINPFDLLNDDDHVSDQDGELETADETLLESSDKQDLPDRKGNPNVVSRSNHKPKKKKKKKNKEASSESTHKDEKPFDIILEALSLDVNTSSHQHAPEKGKAANTRLHDSLVKRSPASILQVDPKYLNAENELRRIFGSKVVKSFEKSNQSGTGSSRQVRGGRRGGYIPRKTVLVTASEHWPRWDGSFSMEFLEVKDGYHYFRYVHSSSYSQAQSAFEAAKAIHDLNGIASILLYNPYHLDSLLTMADYFKFMGEQQMSADSISKCLYALECAWHPMFTPFQGNCQVRFSDEKNKPLFTTLFAHMKNMDRRGCHRSALEVCKLLLSLDSDDPMGAKFYIDYLSLRAEEYAWLEQFSEDYQSDSSLWLFPNFSYSLAICRFYREKQESEEGAQAVTTKSCSTDLMKQALMLHPSVIKKLVEKVPLKDQAWTGIVKHSFFRAEQVGIPSLDHLINMYVETNYLIWRLPDLQKLLRNAVQQIIEILKSDSSEAKDWACVRKEAFSSEKNEYRHLLVLDFSHSVPTLPPENLQHFIVDPRMREVVHNDGNAANANEGIHAPRNVTNRNALAVLFESMLPWVHYEDVNGAIEDEDHQLNGHGQENEEH